MVQSSVSLLTLKFLMPQDRAAIRQIDTRRMM
jgi:hypothetical protein